MIASLHGVVESLSANVLTLNVQGVGYEVHCTTRCANTMVVGSKVSLVIYTDVKEDSIKLYGFEDSLEKQVFRLLTRVKGLGAKSACEVLSKVEKRELLRLIASGDSTRLQSVKGIGKKTSERIILELKDKVAEYAMDSVEVAVGELAKSEPVDDALQALQALGFSRKDAEAAVKKAGEGADMSALRSGEIVREALRFV